MAKKPPSTLLLPALKARMGDWSYYIAFMRFSDVVQRISIAEEIHAAKELKELLQRGLQDRAPEIAEYLSAQPQRFFNALVVGTYGGRPEWHEVSIKSKMPFRQGLPGYLDGALGLLQLSGDETLFAIDGQHRVAGIRYALAQDATLEDEELAVIFLKGVSATDRDSDPEGFERTRRLFTTLNSRAKAVSKKDIIALDEDDIVAIITRRLIEENKLFHGKVHAKGVKSIPRTNKTALTTIVGLYDALDALLQEDVRSLELQKRKRPDETRLAVVYKRVCDWYQYITKKIPAVGEMFDAEPGDSVAGMYRGEEGGHILYRPIGFVMLHRVGRWLMRSGCSMQESVSRLAAIPMMLQEKPWVGLLWDDVNNRMIYAAENQRAADRVMFHGAGGHLRNVRSSPTQLREELSGLLHAETRSVRLRRYAPKLLEKD